MKNPPILKLSQTLLFLASCCLAPHAWGTYDPTQENAPIQIQSDTAYIEQLSKQATYEGNVILKQGTHILHADKLTLKKNDQGHLALITATGSPATFEGKLEISTHTIYAAAKTILYHPDKKLLELQGEATMEHQQDKFKGPMLSYQLDKQIISASKQSDERPTIIIHPRA